MTLCHFHALHMYIFRALCTLSNCQCNLPMNHHAMHCCNYYRLYICLYFSFDKWRKNNEYQLLLLFANAGSGAASFIKHFFWKFTRQTLLSYLSSFWFILLLLLWFLFSCLEKSMSHDLFVLQMVKLNKTATNNLAIFKGKHFNLETGIIPIN